MFNFYRGPDFISFLNGYTFKTKSIVKHHQHYYTLLHSFVLHLMMAQKPNFFCLLQHIKIIRSCLGPTPTFKTPWSSARVKYLKPGIITILATVSKELLFEGRGRTL